MQFERAIPLAIRRLCACAAVAIAMASTSPAAAQGSLALLESLRKGGWEVRFRDGPAPRKLCLRTGKELLQLHHGTSKCGRYAIESSGRQLTVQYSCKADGYARTTVRKETATLVQIEGHGVADGRPFQYSAEARRVSGC